jgi:periplasmic divalent cation tolerance protein
MIKTVKENFDKICLTVISIHPYDMPEIIAIPIVSGATQYMEWIKNETSVDNEM